MRLPLPDPGDLGTTDCEQLRDAVLAQPVGALTSLGYVAGGGFLLWRWRTLPARQRTAAVTYAGLLAAVGAGSFAFHGPQGPGSKLAHDLPIALLLTEAAAVPLVRLAARRRVLRPASPATRVALTGLTGLAVAAYAAGRTGSPVCDPESLLQAHGLWHVTGAAVLALWGTLLWPAPQDAPQGAGAAVSEDAPERT
ncbi:hypothetical protein OEB99_05580 [Actinotalea sp. M2MS4P-6]|uniref:hypothetical protein n=1 Tax=Actinotalea sp. M2MS4P-6 TaxID=2983762 RepID=UPI0021E3C90A|nr:hypothetical protein [Actinotalea sp. M2MS4P-6]MCV2393773.1 hypothetical protein [Actinotalea sp. M2MS4P-6]